MKRWRRPLIVVALLLLVGAVVNVLVSLALAAQGGGKLRDREEYVRQWSVMHKAEWEYNRRRPERYKPTVTLGGGQGSVTANDFGLRMSLIGRRDDCALTIDTGWPARALRYTATYADGLRQTSGVRWPANDGRFAASCGGIPTAPIPAGFAINTFFYAVLLALPLSFFPMRRRLRARRARHGRCPKCGYDRAGLAGVAAACPECGAVESVAAEEHSDDHAF